jgi:hypothetical protein
VSPEEVAPEEVLPEEVLAEAVSVIGAGSCWVVG